MEVWNLLSQHLREDGQHGGLGSSLWLHTRQTIQKNSTSTATTSTEMVLTCREERQRMELQAGGPEEVLLTNDLQNLSHLSHSFTLLFSHWQMLRANSNITLSAEERFCVFQRLQDMWGQGQCQGQGQDNGQGDIRANHKYRIFRTISRYLFPRI